ncbi:CUE domain protein, partial [Aspergillus sclerotioniger CBS 115572]
MDRFVSKKRPRSPQTPIPQDEDSTDLKLTLLMSLFPDMALDALMEILVSSSGCVETASAIIKAQAPPAKKRVPVPGTPAIQTSLASHIQFPTSTNRTLPPKGTSLHLYSPTDIATYTPCTLIHNFLPSAQANALLIELLAESPHFFRPQFQLFSRTVSSPHSSSIYVSTPEEHHQHTSEYTYGGTYRSNVRQLTPHMRAVSARVQIAVNEHIRLRPKLPFQSPQPWTPNAAFVNCYAGPAESVGYHSDELTYLGPRPIIGSLSLGVEREFRLRKIVPDDDEETQTHGQISIHLPHNSLLIMHAEMQEEWKHAIAPAKSITLHPVSGNKRINITYRWYRDSLHPRYTPRCQCGEHTILRCVQRKQETKGRYMWMCYAGFAPGKTGCGYFQWAEFDDDGEPVWEGRSSEGSGEEAPRLRNFVEDEVK